MADSKISELDAQNSAALLERTLSSVYNVLHYGADRTGASLSIQAFLDATEDAYENGGGVVYAPTGRYNVYGYRPRPGVELRGDPNGMWFDKNCPDLGFYTRPGAYGTVVFGSGEETFLEHAKVPGADFTASGAVLTSEGHGLQNGKRVMVMSTGTLPGNLSPATVYWVRDAAEDTFSLSATDGGAAITTSSAGTGTHEFQPYDPIHCSIRGIGAYNYKHFIDAGAFSALSFGFGGIRDVCIDTTEDWAIRVLNPQHWAPQNVKMVNVKRGLLLQAHHNGCAPYLGNADNILVNLRQITAGTDYEDRRGIAVRTIYGGKSPFRTDSAHFTNCFVLSFGGVKPQDTIHYEVTGDDNGCQCNTITFDECATDGLTNHSWKFTKTLNCRVGAHQIPDDANYVFEGSTSDITNIDTGTNVLAVPSHGLGIGDRLVVEGDALPGGVTANLPYYVKTAPSSDTFTLSASRNAPAGSTLNLTSAGTNPRIRRGSAHIELVESPYTFIESTNHRLTVNVDSVSSPSFGNGIFRRYQRGSRLLLGVQHFPDAGGIGRSKTIMPSSSIYPGLVADVATHTFGPSRFDPRTPHSEPTTYSILRLFELSPFPVTGDTSIANTRAGIVPCTNGSPAAVTLPTIGNTAGNHAPAGLAYLFTKTSGAGSVLIRAASGQTLAGLAGAGSLGASLTDIGQSVAVVSDGIGNWLIFGGYGFTLVTE